MIWLLYVTEVALVVASIPAARWLKREGDRSWAHYQRRERVRRFGVLMSNVARQMQEVSNAAMPVLTQLGKRILEQQAILNGIEATATLPVDVTIETPNRTIHGTHLRATRLED